MILRRVFLVGVVLCVGVDSIAAIAQEKSSDSHRPVRGEIAPDFVLEKLSGDKVTLSDLSESGPVVVVVLRGYPGYQCPLCTRQVGEFIAAAKEFEKARTSVILIYPGSAKMLKKYAKEFTNDFKLPNSYHFVLDPDYRMVNSYGLRWHAPNETAYPSTFVVDSDRKVLYSKVSDNHGDRSNVREIVELLKK
jgi:thioredoxin-dependent peroxiredoxin